MRTPLRDDKKINERLDAVQFLTRPDSNQLLKNMRTYLRLVCNVPVSLPLIRRTMVLIKSHDAQLKMSVSLISLKPTQNFTLAAQLQLFRSRSSNPFI